jgi:copper(I)-binding protein
MFLVRPISEEDAMKLAPFVFAAMVGVVSGVALADDYKLGDLEIDHPWSRATPKGAKTAAGYAVIKNNGAEPDRLVGGSLSAAGEAQVHEMKMENGIMKMRPLANGLEVKPGESVELTPGGYHLMFMSLKQPLEKGQYAKGSLKFEKAGSVDVEFSVEATGAGAPSAKGK